MIEQPALPLPPRLGGAGGKPQVQRCQPSDGFRDESRDGAHLGGQRVTGLRALGVQWWLDGTTGGGTASVFFCGKSWGGLQTTIFWRGEFSLGKKRFEIRLLATDESV